MPPPLLLPPRPARRLVSEVIAAVLAPAQGVLVLLLVTLPVTSITVADLERMRASWCGGNQVTGRDAAGSLGAWFTRRLKETALWRTDVPICIISVIIGLVELAVLIIGAAAVVTMSLSPLFHARGIEVTVGPWQVVSWTSAWLMSAVSVPVLLVTLGILMCGSLLRDATLRSIGGSDAVKLRRALQEVRDNRARIVDGFEGERRRIERDLHDGVQQELLAVSITLGMLEHASRTLTGPDAERIRELSSRAHNQADHAVTRLRETVYGIHPRELSDRGLLAGIEQLCARSALDIRVRTAGDDSHVPDAVAAAVYFAVSEALTNVLRHAGVTTAEVQVEANKDQVEAMIVDSGPGGLDLRETTEGGTGLMGLRDRVASVDGTLTIDSPAGEGTTISIHIPTGAQGTNQ